MNKRLIMFTLIIFMLFSLVEAKTFRQDESVSIIHSVRAGGAPVPSTVCNITVLDPTNFIIVNYQQMTNNSASQYNYTIPYQNSTKLGIYNYDITCINSALGYNDTQSFQFEVTPTGTEFTTAQSIVYIFSLILGIFLFALCLWGAIIIPWRNTRDDDGKVVKVNDLKYVKIFLWWMSYCLLLFLTFLAWNITYGFLSFNTASNFFQAAFWILISGMFPIIVVSLLVAVVNFLEDKKFKEALRRGIHI